MNVSLVAADRLLWSGEATVVNTRTLAGEIGIMANHTPILSVLEPGQVDVRTVDDGHWGGGHRRWLHLGGEEPGVDPVRPRRDLP